MQQQAAQILVVDDHAQNRARKPGAKLKTMAWGSPATSNPCCSSRSSALGRGRDRSRAPGLAAPRPRLPADSALTSVEGPRYVIVYVEDNPSNIAFMQDLLADFERVQLLTAPTAELGIELARARRPHIIIMDINLPGMSGIEASNQLRQWPKTRAIPVIALSDAAMIRDTARVLGAGFYRYLTKPVKVTSSRPRSNSCCSSPKTNARSTRLDKYGGTRLD